MFARLLFVAHKRRNATTKALWDPVFRALRKNETPALPKISRRQRAPVLELWLEQRSLGNSDYLARLDELAQTIRLDTIICSLLKPGTFDVLTKHVWQIILAISATRWVHTPATIRYVEEAAESSNRVVAVSACACLARLKSPGYERIVIKTLFRFPEEAQSITSSIGAAGGAAILHILQPFMDKLPSYTVKNFITLAEGGRDPTLIPFVVERLSHYQNDEECAALLRTIGRIGNIEQRNLVRPFLQSDNIILQIQAVKAIGNIGDSTDIQYLLPFLTAPEWWLRYRSAEAIVKLNDCGDEFIDTLVNSLSDQYSIDILRHVHSEQEWCLT